MCEYNKQSLTQRDGGCGCLSPGYMGKPADYKCSWIRILKRKKNRQVYIIYLMRPFIFPGSEKNCGIFPHFWTTWNVKTYRYIMYRKPYIIYSLYNSFTFSYDPDHSTLFIFLYSLQLIIHDTDNIKQEWDQVNPGSVFLNAGRPTNGRLKKYVVYVLLIYYRAY